MAEEAAEEVQELRHGEPRIERHALQLDANSLLDRLRVPADVQAENLDGAGVRRPQALQDFDRGCLAGPIGAEHPEDLAPRDLERDPVDGFDVPVVLLQVSDADDGLAALRHLTPWPSPAGYPSGPGISIPLLTAPRRKVIRLANDRLSAAGTSRGPPLGPPEQERPVRPGT
jgi:hypothetical protein